MSKNTFVNLLENNSTKIFTTVSFIAEERLQFLNMPNSFEIYHFYYPYTNTW